MSTVKRRRKVSTHDRAVYGARIPGAIGLIDRHTNFGDADPRANLDGTNDRGE